MTPPRVVEERIRDEALDLHARIVGLYESGKRVREISRELHVPHGTVSRHVRTTQLARIRVMLAENKTPIEIQAELHISTQNLLKFIQQIKNEARAGA